MKTLSILLALFLTLTSCNCQKKAVEKSSVLQKQANSMKLIYEANSRGFYRKITIENNQAFVSTDRNLKDKGTAMPIPDKDWNELSTIFKEVKLDNVSTFKDPTQKRFYDGAAIANLKLYSDQKEYQTTDFDHGFPPVEIEKLVNKINSFAKN